ncbi:MAG TPA: prepilin-type N-terminal cleavage/methylation domain-containing protein, partial [Candidatus Cybelea sp.]|nr:prepilin-type N-terminal cleavage/methylation domain-containing protein [Candidatus Cybelea sp.]
MDDGSGFAPVEGVLNATRETGVTLIEVLVASTLLTIGLLAAARVVAASSTTNRGARTVTQGTVLAVDKMEQLRAASIDDPALALSPPDALA